MSFARNKTNPTARAAFYNRTQEGFFSRAKRKAVELGFDAALRLTGNKRARYTSYRYGPDSKRGLPNNDLLVYGQQGPQFRYTPRPRLDTKHIEGDSVDFGGLPPNTPRSGRVAWTGDTRMSFNVPSAGPLPPNVWADTKFGAPFYNPSSIGVRTMGKSYYIDKRGYAVRKGFRKRRRYRRRGRMSKKAYYARPARKIEQKYHRMKIGITGASAQEVNSIGVTRGITEDPAPPLGLVRIAQGTGYNERLGRKVFLKKLVMRGTLALKSTATSGVVRLAIVRTKTPTAPDIGKIWKTTTAGDILNSWRNLDETNNFEVLRDLTYTLRASAVDTDNANTPVRISMNLNNQCTWNLDGTTPQKGHIYCILVSDRTAGATSAQLISEWTVFYSDMS